MLELKAVARHVGLSDSQTRRVLRSLTSLLQPYIKRGKDNRILVDGSGLAIVDRAVELWRGGEPLNRLCDALTSELKKAPTGTGTMPPNGVLNPEQPVSNAYQTDFNPTAELVSLLKTQVEQQATELATLRERLATLEDRLPALPASTSTRQRLGRWAALRAVVTGRV